MNTGGNDALETAPAAGPPVPPVTATRGPAGALAITALVATLGAVGAGYWWASRIEAPRDAALAARLAAVEAAQGGNAGRFDTALTELGRGRLEQAALAAEVAALEHSQAGLSDSVKALYARDQQLALDWVLAEAEYLVLAASQRLALERDVRTARAALKAADERLRTADHPDLIPLREQLTRDIAALDAVALPDVEGIALYLAEAVARVDALPTKPIADPDMSFAHTREESVSTQNWRGVARAVWADLLSLVEIKDGELPDGVLFDPELSYFLEQNLKLELASARLAVLARDTENFRAAGRLIGDLLTRYYATDDAAVAALLGWLEQQRGLELDPPVPPISGSLDALRGARTAARETAFNPPP